MWLLRPFPTGKGLFVPIFCTVFWRSRFWLLFPGLLQSHLCKVICHGFFKTLPEGPEQQTVFQTVFQIVFKTRLHTLLHIVLQTLFKAMQERSPWPSVYRALFEQDRFIGKAIAAKFLQRYVTEQISLGAPLPGRISEKQEQSKPGR